MHHFIISKNMSRDYEISNVKDLNIVRWIDLMEGSKYDKNQFIDRLQYHPLIVNFGIQQFNNIEGVIENDGYPVNLMGVFATNVFSNNSLSSTLDWKLYILKMGKTFIPKI